MTYCMLTMSGGCNPYNPTHRITSHGGSPLWRLIVSIFLRVLNAEVERCLLATDFF